MEKVRKELRDELYRLRLQLELIKKERIEEDERIKEIETKISAVRRQIAQELIEHKEDIKNGKTIDISSYNKNSDRYTNTLNKAILKVSTNISGVAKDLVSGLFSQMEKSMDNYSE